MNNVQIIKNFEKNVVNEDENFLSALQKLEECFHKILIVMKNEKLVGLISNGDLRRGLLESGSLTDPIQNIINYDFDFLEETYSEDTVQKYISKNLNPYIPVVGKDMSLKLSLIHI